MSHNFVVWYLFFLLFNVLTTFSIHKADNMIMDGCELELCSHYMIIIAFLSERKKIMTYRFNI